MSEPTSAPANGRAVACPGREDAAEGSARGVAASLERIAGLHDDLAGAYRDLSHVLGIELADLAERSDLLLMSSSTPAPATSQPEGEFVCQQELADLLGCGPRTVRRMELEGVLPPATHLGGLKRWHRPEILAWIEEHRPAKRSARR